MKTNLKRILAVLISLALVFSVCTMGLTVSAAEENTDGYYVLADGTDCGWVNDGNNVKNGVTDGSSFGWYTNRVTPQFVKTGAHIWLGTKNYTDVGVNAADVKTISIYLNNAMDTTLSYRLARSTEDTTYGAENRYWNLSGGYAYLLDTFGYVLPVYVEGGWLNVPAGFEGYVIYDVPTFAAASKLEATNFTAMAFDIKNTKEMLTQAWYFGEVAVSTMSAEELLAYHNNDEAPQFFLANDGTNNYTEHPNVFETRNTWGYNGDAVEFTTINGGKRDANIKAPFYGWTAKTDVIGALDDAIGFSFYMSVDTETQISVAPCINGQQNNLIDGTIYLVGFDGSVEVITDTERDGLSILTDSFEGMVYVIPDEIESTWGTTTYEDWKAKGFTGINFYCRKSSTDEEGTYLTFDNVSLIYDADIAKAAIQENGLIVSDGSACSFNNAKSGGIVNNETTNGDAIEFVTKTQQWANLTIKSLCGTVLYPEDVSAFSFDIKVPALMSGATDTFKVGVCLDSTSNLLNLYNTTVYLIDKDGTVTNAAIGASTSADYKNKILIPSGFDGTVVVPINAADSIIKGSDNVSFADYIAANGNKIKNVILATSNRWSGVQNEVIRIDDLHLNYKDVDLLVDEISENNSYSVYHRSYVVNNGAGKAGHTMGMYNWAGASDNGVTTTDVYQGDNMVSYAITPVASNTGSGANVPVAIKTAESKLPAKLDLAYANAYSMWISVPEFEEGEGIRISLDNVGETSVSIKPSFAVYEDGTVLMPDAEGTLWLNGFTGRVFYEFADVEITYNSTTYDWAGFVNARVEAGFTRTSTKTTLNTMRMYFARTSTNVNENYTIYIDDFRFHFEDSIYYSALACVEENEFWIEYEKEQEELEAKEQAKVAFAADTLDKAKFGDTIEVDNGDGTTTTTNLFEREIYDAYYGMGRYGSAIHYKRVDGLKMGPKDAFYNTEHGLTKAELAEKEALVMWMSIPEDAPGYGSQTRINTGGHHIWSSIITANTLTEEINYIEAYDRSLTLEPGFEGYVIIPLENAVVKTTGWGTATPVAWSDYVTEHGFTSYQFYYNEQKNLEWSQGEIRLVDDIQSFLIEAGATTVAGDLNYDQESNILDLIRAKKYAAGAATQIAYQNLDVDENGTLDIAADIVGMKKLLLGEDHVAEEVIDHAQYGVHMFHGSIGEWDNEFSHLALEEEVLNTYITSDLHEIALAREQGASVWLYVGGTAKATDAYKEKMTALVDRIKELKLWNTVVGVFYEEPSTTDEEFIALSEFFDELVGKRQLACLSSAQIATATPARYQYLTDIGYDNYHIDLAGHRTAIESIRTNTGLTDAPLWFFPQVFGNNDEATMIAELEMYETLIAEQENFGGIMYYTWVSWSDSTPGLKEIVNDKGYDDLINAVVDLSKGVIAKQ